VKRILIFAILVFAALFVDSARAQTVRGQILLPGGEIPQESIRFSLTSSDGRVNEIRFTDSNGRFILERLSSNIDYTIEVQGQETLYGTTTFSFNPAYGTARMTLNPPARKPTLPGTISATSVYKPNPEAVDLREAAQKDIEKEDFDAAEVKLRRAVLKDPRFAAAQLDLGAVLMQGRKYADAEQALRQAIAADPKSHVALLNLGVALNRQQKFADAVPFLKDALRLQPGLVSGHLHLGIALVETEQTALAERELILAIKKPGEEETAGLLYLGKLYAMTGEFPKGVDALEKYLQKAPAAANVAEVKSLIQRMKSEMAKARP